MKLRVIDMGPRGSSVYTWFARVEQMTAIPGLRKIGPRHLLKIPTPSKWNDPNCQILDHVLVSDRQLIRLYGPNLDIR